MPDAVGKLIQLGFIEGLAGVGGGFVDGVDGKELELAAILHDGALLWARWSCGVVGAERPRPSAHGGREKGLAGLGQFGFGFGLLCCQGRGLNGGEDEGGGLLNDLQALG